MPLEITVITLSAKFLIRETQVVCFTRIKTFGPLGTMQNLSLYGTGAKGDGADTFSELHGSGAQKFFWRLRKRDT